MSRTLEAHRATRAALIITYRSAASPRTAAAHLPLQQTRNHLNTTPTPYPISPILNTQVRCQHSYRGRHAECSDLGRLLRALTASSFPALAHLHLTRLPISGPQLLALCGGLPGLRSLSVRGLTAAAALTCDSLGHLAHMTQLTQLSVDHVLLRVSLMHVFQEAVGYPKCVVSTEYGHHTHMHS